MDGIRYFTCHFHIHSANFEINQTNYGSFIRYGKIQIGGISVREAILEKYRPGDMMTEEEK